MRTLSPTAAALVTDIARNYGLSRLAPDANGLIRVEIDGQAIIIAFSDAWNSAILSSVIGWDAALPGDRLYRAFALRGRFAGRTTRLSREPETGALVLVAEIGLKGLHYATFEPAVKDFLADARLAQAELSLPVVEG